MNYFKILLLASIIIALSACGNGNKSNPSTTDDTTEVSDDVESTPKLKGLSMKLKYGDTLIAGAFNPVRLDYPSIQNLKIYKGNDC